MSENIHIPPVPTLSRFRERVYKVLELHTVNGEPISEGLGIKADIARRFTEALRHALLRVAVRFPLNTRRFTINVYDAPGSQRTAVLPPECFRVLQVIGEDGIRKKASDYTVENGVITLYGTDETLCVVCLTLPALPDAAEEDTPLDLPPMTYEALVFMTAMLLCPTENTALYERIASEYAALYTDSAAERSKTVGRVRNTLFTASKAARPCPA